MSKKKKKKLVLQKHSPEAISLMLAKYKADSLDNAFNKAIIIGSDQILVCNNKIYDKAKTKEEAIENLLELQGNEHNLISSTYIAQNKTCIWSCTKTACLFFYPISKNKIKNYVQGNSEAVFSSVGCYQIENNHRFKFVKIISGNNETIMGFPIEEFIKINRDKL